MQLFSSVSHYPTSSNYNSLQYAVYRFLFRQCQRVVLTLTLIATGQTPAHSIRYLEVLKHFCQCPRRHIRVCVVITIRYCLFMDLSSNTINQPQQRYFQCWMATERWGDDHDLFQYERKYTLDIGGIVRTGNIYLSHGNIVSAWPF